jgi:RNA polymerase sigma-70 factor (ECF subfamily)
MENFNEIYAKNYGIIFNYVVMKLHNTQDAEEVTNDIFLKALKYYEEYFDKTKSKFETWLYNIAKNTVIDIARKNKLDLHINVGAMKNSEGLEVFQFEDNCKTDDLIENKELKVKIDFAMNNLKPKYKRIAELYFLQDKPYKEIAILCEVPLNTVKVMINRVRTMLQADLKSCVAA